MCVCVFVCEGGIGKEKEEREGKKVRGYCDRQKHGMGLGNIRMNDKTIYSYITEVMVP